MYTRGILLLGILGLLAAPPLVAHVGGSHEPPPSAQDTLLDRATQSKPDSSSSSSSTPKETGNEKKSNPFAKIVDLMPKFDFKKLLQTPDLSTTPKERIRRRRNQDLGKQAGQPGQERRLGGRQPKFGSGEAARKKSLQLSFNEWILPICMHVDQNMSEDNVNELVTQMAKDHNACGVTLKPFIYKTSGFVNDPNNMNSRGQAVCPKEHLEEALKMPLKRRLVHSYPPFIDTADKMCDPPEVYAKKKTYPVAGCAEKSGAVAIMDMDSGRNAQVAQHEEGHNLGGGHVNEIKAKGHIAQVWGFGIGDDLGPSADGVGKEVKNRIPLRSKPIRLALEFKFPQYLAGGDGGGAERKSSRGSGWTPAGCQAMIRASSRNVRKIPYNPKQFIYYTDSRRALNLQTETSFVFPKGLPGSGGGGPSLVSQPPNDVVADNSDPSIRRKRKPAGSQHKKKRIAGPALSTTKTVGRNGQTLDNQNGSVSGGSGKIPPGNYIVSDENAEFQDPAMRTLVNGGASTVGGVGGGALGTVGGAGKGSGVLSGAAGSIETATELFDSIESKGLDLLDKIGDALGVGEFPELDPNNKPKSTQREYRSRVVASEAGADQVIRVDQSEEPLFKDDAYLQRMKNGSKGPQPVVRQPRSRVKPGPY